MNLAVVADQLVCSAKTTLVWERQALKSLPLLIAADEARDYHRILAYIDLSFRQMRLCVW